MLTILATCIVMSCILAHLQLKGHVTVMPTLLAESVLKICVKFPLRCIRMVAIAIALLKHLKDKRVGSTNLHDQRLRGIFKIWDVSPNLYKFGLNGPIRHQAIQFLDLDDDIREGQLLNALYLVYDAHDEGKEVPRWLIYKCRFIWLAWMN